MTKEYKSIRVLNVCICSDDESLYSLINLGNIKYWDNLEHRQTGWETDICFKSEADADAIYNNAVDRLINNYGYILMLALYTVKLQQNPIHLIDIGFKNSAYDDTITEDSYRPGASGKHCTLFKRLQALSELYKRLGKPTVGLIAKVYNVNKKLPEYAYLF